METEKSSQASKVSEMRRKFEDGEKSPPLGFSKDKYRPDDVSALAGLAAVARRRDKPLIKGGGKNSSPFKTQLTRRSSADLEVTNTDVHQLKQELNANKVVPANQHAIARRTVSEFVFRKEGSEGAEQLNSNGEKPVTPVPVPRRRNSKKQSPNNRSAQGLRDKNVGCVAQKVDDRQTGLNSSLSWLHESNNTVKTTPITDKIRRPLPELPCSSPLPFTPPASDKTSPNTNATKVKRSEFNSPKVPCGGVSGGLVQQIVQGINSSASPTLPVKSSNSAKMQTGSSDLGSSPGELQHDTNGESGHNGVLRGAKFTGLSRLKLPNVQDAIKNFDSVSADTVVKPLPKGPPPHKPPRTFAYDVYLAQKALNIPIPDGNCSDGKTCDARHDCAANHVYYEVTEHRGGGKTPEGSDKWVSDPRIPHRRTSLTSPNDQNGTKHPESKTPPPPPPVFRRNNDTPVKKHSASKTPTVPYAVAKLQHRIISKFGHSIHFGHQQASSAPTRKSNFFVDLKKKISSDGSRLAPKRSLSNEHIYDEPYTEPELLGPRQLTRSLSDEAISNPEYDGLSCKSGFNRPKLSAFPERGNTNFTNGCEHSAKETGLHYMSTPILRKTRSYSYDECIDTAKPAGNKLHSKAWIKANCETPAAPTTKPPNPVAVRSVVNQSFSRSSHYRQASDVSEANTEGQEDDSGDSDHELPPSVLERRIKYIRSVSRAASVKLDRPHYLQQSFRHLFECIMVVGLRYTNRRDVYNPYLKLSYPEDAQLPDCKMSTVLPFCFPDAEFWKPSLEGENFTFVLTDDKGGRSYGYCRRIKPSEAPVSLPVVYCIVSHVLDFRFYYQILQELESHHGSTDAELLEYFECLFYRRIPRPGSALRLSDHDEGKEIWRSLHPFTEHYGVDQLLKCLDITNLLKVFSATLLERRIIFSSSRLSKLSQCVHGLQCLLHPFSWQHTLVPVLPSSLLEVTCTPTPYIIGIVSNNIPDLDETEEALIVDLDRNRFIEETSDDLTTVIPKKFQKALIIALKIAKSIEDPAGSSQSLVSEAFLRMFVETAGHYGDFIITQQDGKKIFEREQFCSALESKSTNSFLQWFTETQMFEVFINDRLINSDSINKDDLFESRIREYLDGSEHMRQSLRGNVKEFKRKVKNFGGRLIGLKQSSRVQ